MGGYGFGVQRRRRLGVVVARVWVFDLWWLGFVGDMVEDDDDE